MPVLVTEYPDTGSTGRGPSGERPRLDPGATAGGLDRVEFSGGDEQPRSPAAEVEHPLASLTGVPTRQHTFALYYAGPEPGRISFRGVELPEPLDVAAAGPALAATALPLALGDAASARPVTEARQYDTGGMGGQVWCQTFEVVLLGITSSDNHTCLWIDEWTVGMIVVNDHAIAGLGLTEAGSAELLAAMRADIEIRP